MEQAEAEHECQAPPLQVRHEQVFDRDIRDRDGDQRLDDPRGQVHEAEHAESERDGVRHSERGHLSEDESRPAAEQIKAEHEEHMIETARHDVRNAQHQVLRGDGGS